MWHMQALPGTRHFYIITLGNILNRNLGFLQDRSTSGICIYIITLDYYPLCGIAATESTCDTGL
jgi:hypothetical protein